MFKTHPAVRLEDLVLSDNFYREIEAKLDLTFAPDLLRDCYSPRMGHLD